MKLITYTTDSHRAMCERFVIANAKAAGFSGCQVFEAQQLCKSGSYNSEGFSEQMWIKVHCLSEIAIGERVCYVDADCVLFPGLAKWCNDWLDARQPHTIGMGDDAGQYCMGTLVFQQTQETKDWWLFIHRLSWILGIHDQNAVNLLLKDALQVPVSLEKLDKFVFANWATYGDLEQKKWNGTDALIVPSQTLCWHANFCIGVETKIRMLDIVGAKPLLK